MNQNLNNNVVLQKFLITVDSSISLLNTYFRIVAAANNIRLSKRELDLIVFTALHRDISSGGKKEEFVKQHGSSVQTIFNMLPRLKKKGFFVTKDKKVVINPKLNIDHNKTDLNVRIQTNNL